MATPSGAPGAGARTQNLGINSALLHQLSYPGRERGTIAKPSTRPMTRRWSVRPSTVHDRRAAHRVLRRRIDGSGTARYGLRNCATGMPVELDQNSWRPRDRDPGGGRAARAAARRSRSSDRSHSTKSSDHPRVAVGEPHRAVGLRSLARVQRDAGDQQLAIGQRLRSARHRRRRSRSISSPASLAGACSGRVARAPSLPVRWRCRRRCVERVVVDLDVAAPERRARLADAELLADLAEGPALRRGDRGRGSAPRPCPGSPSTNGRGPV